MFLAQGRVQPSGTVITELRSTTEIRYRMQYGMRYSLRITELKGCGGIDRGLF
jgi:hypothetical protein